MKYNLRNIPYFETLKAFKFAYRHWRIIDIVEHGTATDPYVASIGPRFKTWGELAEYADYHYDERYR